MILPLLMATTLTIPPAELREIEERTKRLNRVSWIAASVAAVTTEITIERGGRELNPLWQDRWKRLLLRPVVVFTALKASEKVAKNPRTKGLGKIMQYAVAGILVTDAGWDVWVVISW